MPKKLKVGKKNKKISKSSLKNNNTARFFLDLGLILVLFSGLYFSQKIYENHKYERSLSQMEKRKINKDVVLQNIIIPSLKITIPIEEGYIFSGFWSLSKNGVSHLNNSGNPGEKRTIIIYGHNWSALFGSLKQIRKGQLIILTTKNQRFNYEVTNIQEVDPEKISSLSFGENKENLILYTCTGFADSKRLIVKALPKNLIQNLDTLH